MFEIVKDDEVGSKCELCWCVSTGRLGDVSMCIDPPDRRFVDIPVVGLNG